MILMIILVVSVFGFGLEWHDESANGTEQCNNAKRSNKR